MSAFAKVLCAWLGFLLGLVSPAWSIEVGQPLPDFSLQTFDGHTASRTAMAGRPALLIFWNTWCPICMLELPRINRLAEKFGARGLTLLAINTAISDSESKARSYWSKSGFGFSSGIDLDFEIGQAFGVRGVPTVFLVDAKGVVRYKHALLPQDIEERLMHLTRD